MGYFVKLAILLVMGLAGMYMMHLLAQDFERIRQPLAAASRFLTSASSQLQLRGKRSTSMQQQDQHQQHQQQQQTLMQHYVQQQLLLNDTLASINWKRILSRDPFECLQSLICQLMSGAEGSHTHDALMLMDFVELSLTIAPAKIGRAFSRGLAVHGAAERCYEEFYPYCFYSAQTMLRILAWFTHSIDNDRNQMDNV